jgi:hypothetical protein
MGRLVVGEGAGVPDRRGMAARTAAALVLAEATYAVVAPRRPMGNRGPETERSPIRAVAVSPVVSSALCSRLPRALAGALTASRCWRARRVHLGRRRAASSRCDGDRVWPGRPPRTKFVVVGDAHEVAVPRGLKVQAPEPDFELGWEGSELPMEYLWPWYSVRITIERASGS